MILYLLILIPVFTMGISVFISSLYEYIAGDFSLGLLIFSSISVILTSIYLPIVFIDFFKPNTKKQLNVSRIVTKLSYYVVYILLFVTSIVFAVKNTFDIKEYLPVYLSYGLVAMFTYYIYAYFIYRKTTIFKVKTIKKVNKNVNLLVLSNDDYDSIKFYCDAISNYEEDKNYKFKFNKNTKLIIKECK